MFKCKTATKSGPPSQRSKMDFGLHLSSDFLVVEPSKIVLGFRV